MQEYQKKVKLMGSDFRWLMGYLGDQAQNYKIPEQYSRQIYQAKDIISDSMDNVMRMTSRKSQEIYNKAYQQVSNLWYINFCNQEQKIDIRDNLALSTITSFGFINIVVMI